MEDIYLRQLAVGPMQNFAYLLGAGRVLGEHPGAGGEVDRDAVHDEAHASR